MPAHDDGTGAPAGDDAVEPEVDSGETDVEAAAAAVELDLAALSAERDDYLATLRRVQADFENYRKRVIKEQTALVERASEGLVEQLLPVLDSFDAALASVPGRERRRREAVARASSCCTPSSAPCSRSRGWRASTPTASRSTPTSTRPSCRRTATATRSSPTPSAPATRYKGKVLRPAMVKVAR